MSLLAAVDLSTNVPSVDMGLKQVVGGILFVTMLFFSALAFTILENAMSVIFYHRDRDARCVMRSA
jgi:hypothetical protein